MEQRKCFCFKEGNELTQFQLEVMFRCGLANLINVNIKQKHFLSGTLVTERNSGVWQLMFLCILKFHFRDDEF